ncbi:MAG: O-acetylhomoserine aminocarboxypropyltransferase/cysteine synthase family protein [Rikenellaceae bacterium]
MKIIAIYYAMKELHFETLQVHAGHQNDPQTGACATPLYQTSSYAFKSSQHAVDLFNLEAPGHIYTRLSNPTVSVFEERIAALEGGVAAVATASGMAAQFLVFQALAVAGDNFVVCPSLYGGTFNQLKVTLPRIGIESRFVSGQTLEAYESLIDENTKGIYVETIGNSDYFIPDFDMLRTLCQRYSIPLIVDNTFAAGGYLCRPKELGANIIVHSATKWIGGHGNSIGGVVVDCGNFDWSSGRFPLFTEPSPAYKGLSFHEAFGSAALAVRLRAEGLRDYGACLSPFNALMLLTGVETLSLRVDRICENALALALWLEEHPAVESVNYPGLPHNQNHAAANKYLRNGYGGVLTFCLKGSLKQASKFVESLKMISFLANVGDNKSLITHPASTTHSQLNEEALAASGIAPTALRFSLGIENVEDIKADIEQALTKI